MTEDKDFECSVVGRCCESGDIIQEHVMLPRSVQRRRHRGRVHHWRLQLLHDANYNRLARPPIVMLSGGKSYVAVRRVSGRPLLSTILNFPFFTFSPFGKTRPRTAF